jgi:glutaredoxin
MIKIYGKDWCPYCTMAQDLATTHGLKYEYVDIETNDQALQEYKTNFPDLTSVPQIVWAGRHVGGYDDFALEVENTRTYGQEAL